MSRSRVVVAVPYRAHNGPRRDLLWRYVRGHLEKHHPDYPIYLGESSQGLFNRAHAINDAATKAGAWDIVVVCDADTFVAPAQLDEAVGLAAKTGRLVAAFTSVVELDRTATERFLSGDENPRLSAVRIRTHDIAIQSSVLAVPRTLWDAVEGFDTKFCGWGGEDNAFWQSCAIIGGEPLRIDGPALHLWHRSVKPTFLDYHYQLNQRRWHRYAQAQTVADIKEIRTS